MQSNLHIRILGGISEKWLDLPSNFVQGSITINGWLRDFLWAQASQVIVCVRYIIFTIKLRFLI
jgi:photosystem I P700 chlorophyll a apoprotein A1